MSVTPTLLNYYRNRKVLITGHTGFKGSWLAIWLRELGAEVTGYALEPTTPSLFNVCGLGSKIISVRGDVRDLPSLMKVLDTQKPEIIFHLAAQSLVRRSYREPVETYETNVMGTVYLLEACKRSPSVRTIINVTSDKCYDNDERGESFRETDPLGGRDPYSSSKGCAELATKAYASSYFGTASGKALSSVRAGNVIGGGDWADERIIPDCIRALRDHQPIVIRNPRAVRPWQHVLEPLYGYLLLAQKMDAQPENYSGAWNFGATDATPVTVEELVKLVIAGWGGGEFVVRPDSGLHEMQVLKLDSSKARTNLGWSQRWDVRTAVAASVEWYKKQLADEDMYALSKSQIKTYSDGLID